MNMILNWVGEHKFVNVDDIVKRWDDLGILAGLSTEQTIPTAIALESMAIFLLEEVSISQHPEYERAESMIFAVIRRLCGDDKYDDYRTIWTSLVSFIEQNKHVFDLPYGAVPNLNNGTFDPEVWICQNFTDNYEPSLLRPAWKVMQL